MKRLIPFIALALVLAGCYKDDLRQMHKDIESMRDVTVPALSQQTSLVEASVADLNALNTELKGYVADLTKSCAAIRVDLNKAGEQLVSFQEKSESDINTSYAGFMSSIKALNETASSEIKQADAALVELNALQTALSGKIDGLKTYIEDKYAKKDWLSATFATLDKQNEIMDDIAGIKTEVAKLKSSSEELNKKLIELIDNTVAEYKSAFTGDVREQAAQLVTLYQKSISEMIVSVSAINTENLQKAVAASETSVKSWVSTKLGDYYTIAEAEAQIKALNLILGTVPEGKSLQGEIDGFTSDFTAAKAAIKEAYEKAIADAIQNNEGIISEELASAILAVRTDVIEPLAAKVTPLAEDVDKLRAAVSEVESRISTVSGQVTKINTSLKVLSDVQMTLKQYVEAMKTELEKSDSDNYTYLKGLLDNLSVILESDDPSSLPSQITALKNYVGTLPEGATSLTQWVEATLSSLEQSVKVYALVSNVDEIVRALNASVLTQKTDIANCRTNLDKLVDEAKDQIEGWITLKLKPYYNIAAADGRLTAFNGEINSYFTKGDAALQARITAINNDLDKALSEIEPAYKAKIKELIEEYDGKIDQKIADELETLNSKITGLSTKVTTLSGTISELRTELNGYQTTVSGMKTQLAALQEFFKVNGYETLDALVTDMRAKLENLKDVYASKSEFETLKNYVDGDLKTDAGKVQGLVDRMTAVNGTLDAVGSFLKGFDGSEKDLKEQIEEITEKIGQLKDAVNGSGDVKSLNAQIDDILVAFYGADKNPESPSKESIVGILNACAARLAAAQLSSITYVPKFLDQKETLSFDGTNTVQASFSFIVKPAAIAKMAASNPELFRMKYRTFANPGTAVNFATQTVTVSDDVITIKVKDSSNGKAIHDGASAALFFENKDSDGNVLSSFTSQPVYFGQNGSGKIPVDNDHLYFPAEGGSLKIVVGYDGIGSYWYVRNTGYIKDLIFTSLWPEEWLEDSVSPSENVEPWDIGVIDRWHYEGQNELTVTVGPNPNTTARSGQMVFRIISYTEFSNKDLVIYVEQAGKAQ